MENYKDKIAIAFNQVKEMFETGLLAGLASQDKGMLEGDVIHYLRSRTRLTEEESIDLVDILNIKDVLEVASNGEFFFNEVFANVIVLD